MKNIIILFALLVSASFAQYPQNDPYHAWDDISIALFDKLGAEGDWVECPEIPEEVVNPDIVQFRYCRAWSSDTSPEELQTLFDTAITSEEVGLESMPLSNWIVRPVLMMRTFSGRTDNDGVVWTFWYYRDEGILEAVFAP